MELLSQYISSSPSVSSDEELEPAKAVRSVYLVTYSQADLSIFPDKQSFADAVCEAVLKCEGPKSKVIQWTCCQENHKKRGGKHYHMAVKLNKIKRWLPIWQYLKNKWNVYVHFSNRHSNYYSAWLYTTKEDEHFIQSAGHPDLTNSGPPRTMAASQARGKRRQPVADVHDSATDTTSGGEGEAGEESAHEYSCSQMTGENVSKTSVKRKRSKRLSCYEVSNIIIEKKIKNRTELLALANAQKAEGKIDLAEFVMNRGSRVVQECISTAWEMEKASEALERNKLTRLQILEKCLEDPCTAECNGQWIQCAKQLLRWNHVSIEVFTEAVRNLLEQGRGKFRNILIKGPANTGKTFLLNPLNIVYKSFINPATSTFAWVGAEKAEVVFLNDFRWNSQIIQWHDLLLMLEGQPVHLPAPKSHFSKDLEFNNDTPIFCTTKHDLIYVKAGVVDQMENEMMAVRWNAFQFQRQIPQDEQLSIPPCARCFAEFILSQ